MMRTDSPPSVGLDAAMGIVTHYARPNRGVEVCGTSNLHVKCEGGLKDKINRLIDVMNFFYIIG